MTNPGPIRNLDQVPSLGFWERTRLKPVTDRFSFLANEYYLGLINWEDPKDPIKRIVIPAEDELTENGALDACNESKYTMIPGLQHKYGPTVLALVSENCAGYCRFCFRKRLFLRDRQEILTDFEEMTRYLKKNPSITDVLLTGGDALLLSTPKLEKIISAIRSIDHIKLIRIGTKLPAYNPFRTLNDPSLLNLLSRFSKPGKRIYIMTHFNHPRELTAPAIASLELLQSAQVVLANQTPLLMGVNDDPLVLSELFKRLSGIGVPPYYVFQCRPTRGNRSYALPIEQAFQIFDHAQRQCSGLAKRAKFVMSHASGKIEILGMSARQIFLKYHSCADPENDSKMMIFERNPKAYWLEDYQEQLSSPKMAAAIFS
jgi:KamA family protein